MRVRARRIAILAAALVHACGDGGTDPTPATVELVELAPSVASIAAGDSLAIAATARDTRGRVITGRSVWWRSNDSLVAHMDQYGVVRGISSGPVTVSAVIGGVTGTSAITVYFGLDRIDLGDLHSCGLTPAGAAYCWGANITRQLGNGTSTSRSRPVAVSGGLLFSSVSAGRNHTCGLTLSGAAYCWGGIYASTPQAIGGGLAFTRIAVGENSNCAITTAGAAYCWGANFYGQLGDSTIVDRVDPTAVAGGLVFSEIAVGAFHACGIAGGGIVHCWGDNGYGRLGDGTVGSYRTTPAPVSGGVAFTQLAVSGLHGCAIATTGGAYCWGRNDAGQLGDSTYQDRSVPTAVRGGRSFTRIASGAYSSCGVVAGGGAYCWGANGVGQLGAGAGADAAVPIAVSDARTYTGIAAAGDHGCARTADAGVFCWGYNFYGQVGDGTNITRLGPVGVRTP